MDAKKVVPLVVIVGGVVFARKLGPRMVPSKDWGKIIERMPDDAPPKWMFNNITALREEHQRILEQNEQILAGLRRLGEEHGKLLGAGGSDDDGDE